MNDIENIKKNPIETLNILPIKKIVNILEKADEAFFNTNETVFSDDLYDVVKSFLREKDPKNPYFKKVGACIQFNKETLPYYLGSLDKIKDDEKEIIKWSKKYNGDYVVSEKLDGISCLLYFENGEVKLLTRGNGYEGQNVTHILPYLRIDTSKINEKIAIRGELIISRDNWNNNTHLGANARNVVAGAIHCKTINREIVSIIDFVTYDILYPRQKLGDALDKIKNLNIPVVRHKIIEKIDNEILSSILQDWRKSSEYEIDGIVIHDNNVHKLAVGKNPKYAFAFKTILTQEQAEVIVTDVEWNVSKHRYIKPLVKFNEVVLAGVKIKQATGFNAAYIEKNKIGPGSRIIIVRSGDVIPHILSVITPSSTGEGKMPSFDYVWGDTRIDILLKGDDKNREQDVKAFVHFMNTLSVEGVKEGVICKFYDAGYDSLKKIINMKKEDIMLIEGFKEKSAINISEALQGIKDVKCEKLLAASNIFGRGFGEKKIKLIIDEYPYLIKDKEKTLKLKVEDIIKVKGMAKISAEQFIDKLPLFIEFYEEIDIKCNKNEVVENNTEKKLNKKIVFSGFRNKEWEEIITKKGGNVVNTISKNTDILVVKNINDKSTKIDKAKELGVTILSQDAFEEMIKSM